MLNSMPKNDNNKLISNTVTEVLAKRIEERLEENIGSDEWRKLSSNEKKALVNYHFRFIFGSTQGFFTEKLTKKIKEEDSK
jgi:hypothetical protein